MDLKKNIKNNLENYHNDFLNKLNINMTHCQKEEFINGLMNLLKNQCPLETKTETDTKTNTKTSNCKCDPCVCDPCNC